jgi:hypothetical protein
MSNKKRITFKDADTVQVFRLGKSTNRKISNGTKQILQSYTFSTAQFNYVAERMKANEKPVFKTFFALDSANCGDCPFSMNQGSGGCYTHKVMQYSGFISMLKSVITEHVNLGGVPEYSESIMNRIIDMSTGNYVRFGTYGEPTKHPLTLIEGIAKRVQNWSGYTHQYAKKPEYLAYFMASVHSAKMAGIVQHKFGARSFIATKEENKLYVSCPASKEAGFKTNCADCGLCSGIKGKGKKSIHILEH